MSLVRWTRFSSFHSQNDCHNRVCAALLPFPPKTNLPARPCLWRFFWLQYRWVSLDMLLCHFPARKDSNGYCRCCGLQIQRGQSHPVHLLLYLFCMFFQTLTNSSYISRALFALFFLAFSKRHFLDLESAVLLRF